MILTLWLIPSETSHGGKKQVKHGDPLPLRLSAAPRRGSETYFQPGQYKPNLDAVRPKLELEAQDLWLHPNPNFSAGNP